MAQTRLRPPISDRLASRRGAWISLTLALLIMVALFGAFGSAKAPSQNAQAPAGSESTRVSELMTKFPNADRQSVLVVTYRSPVLWLIPLTVVGLADGLAGRMTAAAGAQWNLQFDAGIISVLALLTLVLAVIPGTHGLGVSSAIGLAIALVAVLFVLPPFLAVCGRKVFWPFVPRPGGAPKQANAWRRVATGVVRRPVVSLAAGAALLGVMSLGLIGTSVGLDQIEKFRVQSESATGLMVLSDHFAPGEAQPIYVVADTSGADDVVAAVSDVEGVVRAHPIGTTDDGSLTKIMVTSEYAPSSEESLNQITELRDVAHAAEGADALVGGAVATDLDARAGNEHDLLLVAPLVLAVAFVVLLLLLRSVIAPVLLLLVNLASDVAAIGAGAWLSRVLFDPWTCRCRCWHSCSSWRVTGGVFAVSPRALLTDTRTTRHPTTPAAADFSSH